MSLPDFIPDAEISNYDSGGSMPDFIPDSEIGNFLSPSQPTEVSLPGSIWKGVKNFPSVTIDAIKSIPSGVNNVFQSVFSPIDSLNDGTTEKTLRGAGTLASGVAGAGVGATAGAGIGAFGGPLAPVTVPLGAIAGGAIGGAAGLMGFDWANQATGSDEPTDINQDIDKFGQNIGTGLAGGAVIKGVGSAASTVAKNAPKLANALDRKSLGTRASDYGKGSEVRTILTPDEGTQSFVKTQLDDLLENNKLGTSRNPSKILDKIDPVTKGITNEIDNLIREYDATGQGVAPDFSGARQYLSSGKVPADLVPAYLDRLNKIESGINQMGGGTVEFLHRQKVALGKSYDPADKVLSGFNRAIYGDLKNTIEAKVPQVASLNAELGKYLVAEPIVTRSLKAAENTSPLSTLRDIGYTTGGIGLPTAVGAGLGGPAGAVVGAGLGLTGRALASPGGQASIARGLRNVTSVAKPISSTMNSVFTPVQGALEASGPDEGKSVNGNPKPENQSTMDKVFTPSEGVENMSRLETPEQQQEFKDKVGTIAQTLETDPAFLLQAMNFETGGSFDSAQKNNAGSGATGLIQFMPDTAKALTGEETKEAAIKVMESMTPIEQLDYVQKYLTPYKGKLNSLDDVYMAILWPQAVGKDPDYAVFKEGDGTKRYQQNSGLDINADGIVTKSEATEKVRSFKV